MKKSEYRMTEFTKGKKLYMLQPAKLKEILKHTNKMP
jgi:hypothetical protein